MIDLVSSTIGCPASMTDTTATKTLIEQLLGFLASLNYRHPVSLLELLPTDENLVLIPKEEMIRPWDPLLVTLICEFLIMIAVLWFTMETVIIDSFIRIVIHIRQLIKLALASIPSSKAGPHLVLNITLPYRFQDHHLAGARSQGW